MLGKVVLQSPRPRPKHFRSRKGRGTRRTTYGVVTSPGRLGAGRADGKCSFVQTLSAHAPSAPRGVRASPSLRRRGEWGRGRLVGSGRGAGREAGMAARLGRPLPPASLLWSPQRPALSARWALGAGPGLWPRRKPCGGGARRCPGRSRAPGSRAPRLSSRSRGAGAPWAKPRPRSGENKRAGAGPELHSHIVELMSLGGPWRGKDGPPRLAGWATAGGAPEEGPSE
ncbi:uncharacterized protein LOC141509416 [Macrotis lagotis]|uniref:uncharacterized protein LOC141509416 n=1 Tax=Macrotis lagotis TaxID=92651 RepID=UPI003D68896B